MYSVSPLRARFCRPDQANRAAAGTSASSIDVVHRTGCQSHEGSLRRRGKDSASVRPTGCAIEARRRGWGLGRTIETLDLRAGGVDEDRIIRGMVGRSLESRFPDRTPHIGEVFFEVRDWTVQHPQVAERLVAKGSNLLRKPMNRPHCATPHPSGGVLVGDSATREVYWIESADAEPKPLSGGRIGVPMALVVDPEGKVLYVGDAEKRATFRLPLEGGDPELVARVNARGLAFDTEGKLLAVTPDAAAIQRIDVSSGEVQTLVDGRPFQFPNGLCWAGDQGFVTDTYSNCLWRFTADGKTEKWHEGAPLERPVGIAISGQSLFVADPKLKQVFEFDLSSKEAKPRM